MGLLPDDSAAADLPMIPSPNNSVQATAATLGVFLVFGFLLLMVSFLSHVPASVPYLTSEVIRQVVFHSFLQGF